MKEFRLHFDGSILDENRELLPSYSGVYLVYRGILNSDRKSLHCSEILYIGQAVDIRRRHQNHENRSLFLSKLNPNEVLFYSYAPVESEDLNRVEAALIYKQNPILNTNNKATFPYPATHIISDGQCALLNRDFTVE